MATKRTQRAAQEHAEAKTARSPRPPYSDAAPPGLRPTDTPGVYLNEFNVPVDEDGLALSFSALKRLDRDKLYEVDDESIDGSPAKFMKALALDPRQPMALRFEAAKAAAPYFDRRMPLALDGGTDPDAKPLVAMQSAMERLSAAELETLVNLMRKAGAVV